MNNNHHLLPKVSSLRTISIVLLALVYNAIFQVKIAHAGLIGTITNPITAYGDLPYATVFLSNVIRLITIAAGLYAFINFVLGGVSFISSAGNPEKISSAWQKIYQSIIGLIVVVLAFAFAALMGLLLFGDATAILQPSITGPGP